MKHYRTGWISDVHLGTRGSKAEALLHFLRTHEFEKLYVVGDLIDVWALKRGIYWPQAHNDVIQKLLRAGRKGTEVIYVPGNHDEFISGFHGHYGAVEVMPRAIHTTADGKKLLIIHGHELDTVVQNIKWLAFVGDIGYQLLLRLNGPVNRVRKMLDMEFWSLSAHVKKSVKEAVNFIGAFEEGVVKLARQENVDGVICGHIHTPIIREINGMPYYNTGDWVESTSALVEDAQGRIELITHFEADFDDRAPRPVDEDETPVEAILAGAGITARRN